MKYQLAAIAVAMIFPMRPAVAETASARIELPIRQVDLTNGDRRYTVTLAIDGHPVEVGLDTGSTGLRILPRALSPASLAAKGQHADYSYGSGTQFAGTAIKVSVGFGDLTGTIHVMRIDRLECRDNKPDCPVKHVAADQFGIQGDGLPGQGFAAILGIRPMHDAIDNPLRQLGVSQWIVELPRPGRPAGRLILNPRRDEIAGYQRIGFADDRGNVAGCLVGPDALGKVCALTYFDTGAAGLGVFGRPDFRPWPDGTPAALAVGDGKTTVSADIVVGRRDQASRIVPEPQAPRKVLSFGLAAYFKWSVLYDVAANQIGLRPRD